MTLIAYQQALEIIRSRSKTVSETETVELDAAVGRCLAAPVIAQFDSPKFDNSAVDGYAVFHHQDLAAGTTLRIAGTIAAGDLPTQTFGPGESARVFTGGYLPRSCAAAAMQENVDVHDKTIVLRASLTPGENVRKQGTEFRTGGLLAMPGDVVGPGTIACAASQHFQKLVCVRKPKTAVFSTGDEIVRPGSSASDSQIYDSNAPMLCALVQIFGGEVSESRIVRDSFHALQEALQAASEQNDLIVTAGGVSVGDRDYLPSVVEKLGVVHFHKVSLKPGKPVLFGTIGNADIVCLPGNPASAFVCAHLFVRAALEAMLGQNRPHPRCTIALRGDVATGNRDEFFRCVLQDGEAVIHGEQASFGVQSLMQADCLVHVPAKTHHKSGELRTAIILR